jgi:hypothetical protein
MLGVGCVWPDQNTHTLTPSHTLVVSLRTYNDPPAATHPEMLALFLLAAAAAAQRCQLTIPDSGGASRAPAAFPSALIAPTAAPPDTRAPPNPRGDATADYCGGRAGCEALCCAQASCVAWAWATGGSAHVLCGGNTCTLFTLKPAAPGGGCATPLGALLPALAASAQFTSGYNVGGYVFSSSADRRRCCAPPAAPTTAPTTTPPAAPPAAPPP